VNTVNGSITVGSDVNIGERVSTVNGRIHVGRNGKVRGPVTSVNGSISLSEGTEVSGETRATNGDIRLRSARVGGDIVTQNGDISLQDGSHVAGDLIVKKRRSWLNGWFGSHNKPLIRIDSSSSVAGDIHLYRRVDLEIAEGAQVGEIIRHY
jgi:predicted acyltransferase (DUF342 family)